MSFLGNGIGGNV